MRLVQLLYNNVERIIDLDGIAHMAHIGNVCTVIFKGDGSSGLSLDIAEWEKVLSAWMDYHNIEEFPGVKCSD